MFRDVRDMISPAVSPGACFYLTLAPAGPQDSAGNLLFVFLKLTDVNSICYELVQGTAVHAWLRKAEPGLPLQAGGERRAFGCEEANALLKTKTRMFEPRFEE